MNKLLVCMEQGMGSQKYLWKYSLKRPFSLSCQGHYKKGSRYNFSHYKKGKKYHLQWIYFSTFAQLNCLVIIQININKWDSFLMFYYISMDKRYKKITCIMATMNISMMITDSTQIIDIFVRLSIRMGTRSFPGWPKC